MSLTIVGCGQKELKTSNHQSNRLYKPNIETAACPQNNPCYCVSGSYGVCMSPKDCDDVGGTCR